MINTRILAIKVLALAAFLALLARLGHLQILQGARLRQASEENRIRCVRRLAPRGVIYDRKGRILASNRLSFTVSVVPGQLERSDLGSVFRQLGNILRISSANLYQVYQANKQGRFQPVVLKEDVSLDTITKIEEHSLYLPGVTVDINPVRWYPNGKLAAHVLGYVREISQPELSRLSPQGYEMGDRVGKDGVERVQEELLRGEDGGRQIEVDGAGKLIRILGTVTPIPGHNVVLTIDRDVQAAAERALAGHRGAAIAMDPHTGELWALASSPAFDPNIFCGPLRPSDWAYLNSRARPQQNRATSNRYEPGSVFKIVTAIAALESGKVNRHSTFYCPGYLRLGRWVFRCWQQSGHGYLDLVSGIAHSCNVMFMTLGQRVGPERLAETARSFGFGSKSGIDLPDERMGLIPTPAWKRQNRHLPWYPGDTCQMAIGQVDVLVTPIQVAREVAVIASGGYLVTPHLAKQIIGLPDDQQPDYPSRCLNLQANSLSVLKQGMAEVVRRGTARNIRLSSLPMAGKTGTAQNPQGKAHAWFGGFAPVHDPRLVVVVFIEHGGAGSEVAAPIAQRIFRAALLPRPAVPEQMAQTLPPTHGEETH